MSIRIGILGYGNLGRGVEAAIALSEDLELVAVFTRRDPASLTIATDSAKVLHADALETMQGDIDVLVICGGSATDLPAQTPKYAAMYHVIDSFDNHSQIPTHFEQVDKTAQQGGKVAIISCGWDPGMFSLNRLYTEAILPVGATYTFWGKGVSQGHSDAVRRIAGVADARQYTIPVEKALEAVRSGGTPALTTREKHTRSVFVVAQDGADQAKIAHEIKTMPAYFADYDTTVTFIDAETMQREHSGLPHGGMVIRSGKTGHDCEHQHIIEYRLQLDSNPEFTGAVLTAYARAAYRMAQEGMQGAKTVFDVAPAYLSPRSGAELRKLML